MGKAPLKPVQLEALGRALYGDMWIAQLARELKNPQGEELPQSTLKSMRDRGNFPDYIKLQVAVIMDRKIEELKRISKQLKRDI